MNETQYVLQNFHIKGLEPWGILVAVKVLRLSMVRFLTEDLCLGS